MGEDSAYVQILGRNKIRVIKLPIESALINLSVERQIQPGLVNVTTHDRNHPRATELAELLHLTEFEVAPGFFWQTPPQVVVDLVGSEFIAIGGAWVASQIANFPSPAPRTSRFLNERTNEDFRIVNEFRRPIR